MGKDDLDVTIDDVYKKDPIFRRILWGMLALTAGIGVMWWFDFARKLREFFANWH